MKIGINKNFFFVIALIGMMFILLGEPINNSAMMSVGTSVIFLGILGAFALKIFTWKRIKVHYIELVFLLLLIFSFISFIAAKSVFSVRLVPLLCFLELPMLMTAFDISNKKVKYIIYAVFSLSAVWLALLSISPLAYTFSEEYGETTIKELTLGFSNPNQTAIYLLIHFLVLLIGVNDIPAKVLKFFNAANAIFMLRLIAKTGSRTGLILAISVLLIICLKKARPVAKFLTGIVYVVPIFVAFFILFGSAIYQHWTVLGDEFDTGRATIYAAVFEGLNLEEFFFGNYHVYAQQNLHNSFVSVFAAYGIIVVGLFFLFFFLKTRRIFLGAKNDVQYIAFLAFYAIIVYSSMEAAFLISGSIYAVFVFSLYYLCLPSGVERIESYDGITN